MKLKVVAAAILLASSLAGAQNSGYWKAVSTTARGITGDIGLSPEKLTINFSSYTIAEIRALSAEEAAAVFPVPSGTAGTGQLFRLNIPAAKAMLHHNVLCGAEDTQWMVTFAEGKTLQVAFLSGSAMPVLTPEAVANSTALCGTFSYRR